jgi:hypothetical protein
MGDVVWTTRGIQVKRFDLSDLQERQDRRGEEREDGMGQQVDTRAKKMMRTSLNRGREEVNIIPIHCLKPSRDLDVTFPLVGFLLRRICKLAMRHG